MSKVSYEAIIRRALGDKYATAGACDTALISSFVEAHDRRRGAPSLEIGCDDGRNSRMLLSLIDGLYQGSKFLPMLHTVDPYGDKPYILGDASSGLLYGDRIYTEMKHRVASFPNHAHWTMEGIEFLSYVAGKVNIWRNGLPQRLLGFCFAFVDGDHRADTIYSEVALLTQVMAKDGIIVVDNTDWDPDTHAKLERFKPQYFSGADLAEVAVIHMGEIR